MHLKRLWRRRPIYITHIHTYIRTRIVMNANLIDEDTPRTIVVSTTITIIIYRYNKCKTMKNSCFLTLRRYPRRVFIFPCVSACTAGRHIGKHKGTKGRVVHTHPFCNAAVVVPLFRACTHVTRRQ